MPDVIHDPDADWCACEPNGARRCDYRMLADKVIERLNPPDGDEAEVALLMLALDVAADYITDQPCFCDREPDLPCFRCSALGQLKREPVQR
jgi:hypothetical protein